MQRSIRVCLLAVLWIGFSNSGRACLWDSDTLREEAEGYAEIINAIVGRFPRNPPAYYEARLTIVADRLKKNPHELEAFDDAGVACDRLGRGEEALEWMARKKVLLDRMPDGIEKKTHLYQCHANFGTFIVHEWIRKGARKEDVAKGEEAAGHILQALEINPVAHFGRERAQLRVMEWLILQKGGKVPELELELGDPAPEYVPSDFELIFKTKPLLPYHLHIIVSRSEYPGETAGALAQGLAGMVALGNAWESVDIFSAISAMSAHDREDRRSSVAFLAYLRTKELTKAKKSSLATEPPASSDSADPQTYDPNLMLKETGHLEDWYREARQAADEWQAARAKFILAQLSIGRHPDTDPDFWKGFSDEPKLPAMPGAPSGTGAAAVRAMWFALFAGVVITFAVLTVVCLRKQPQAKA